MSFYCDALKTFLGSAPAGGLGARTLIRDFLDEPISDDDVCASAYNAASYCLSLYVIDTNRSDCRFRCPAGVARRLRTRSTRHFAASDCNVERMKSQGPSSRGCSASIWRCSAARRRVLGLTPSTAAARVKFIQPSASAVSGR